MHCYECYWLCSSTYLKSVLRYKFLILDTCHLDTLFVSKDMRTRDYFSKPKGIHQQKGLGNTALIHMCHTTFKETGI